MKKILVLSLCLMMVVSIFAGCGQSNVIETTAETTTEETTTEETTTEETTTEETTTEDPTPEGNVDYLTGLYDLPDEAVGTRPVAIMVNNVPDAMPQYGISEADIIVEMPVEGNQTRFLAIYPSCVTMPYIVSIRSYRYYFPPIALGFDAIYVHWGEDTSMLDYYYSLGMSSYDGISSYPFFSRDQGRLNQGYALEHTSAFDGTAFYQYISQNGERISLDEDYANEAFYFVGSYDEPEDPNGDDCIYAQVNFGAMYSTFDYSSEDHKYYKTNCGNAQVDGITGEQLSFTNVIMLETSVWTRDDGYHKGVDWYGGEDSVGYYISNGKIQKIHWAKENEYARLKLYDENWQELYINRGKTYIAFCPYDSVYAE